MFANPKDAIDNKWIIFPEWVNPQDYDKFIQPNALDITLDRVFKHEDKDQAFILSEEHKVMKKQVEIQPEHGYFSIDTLVDVMSDFYINVPQGMAAYLIGRSTLNRNGLFVTSGLYDQGFQNYIGFMLHNRGNTSFIAPHTRVAQVIFVKSDDAGIMYNGEYNANIGKHWSENIQ